MRKGNRIISAILALVSCALVFAGCGSSSGSESTGSADQVIDGGNRGTLRILSGSENKELTNILQDFADREGVKLEMDYKGSLDIMRTLQKDPVADEYGNVYDAVWPASSMWITAGDGNHVVKHAESISVTPVIFGIRESLAEELGFAGRRSMSLISSLP